MLRERYVPPDAAALVHAGLGRLDTACEWLDCARQVRDVHLALVAVDPKWKNVRKDHAAGRYTGGIPAGHHCIRALEVRQ